MFVRNSSEDIKWLIRVQVLVGILGSVFFGFIDFLSFSSYLIGALLSFFNFLVLARRIPVLIKMSKGSVFFLLVSFYFRLLFTALVLFICIAVIRLPVYSLLLGLSTVVITVFLWMGKFIFITYYKQKEA